MGTNSNRLLGGSCLLGLLFVAGCSQQEQPPASITSRRAANQAQKQQAESNTIRVPKVTAEATKSQPAELATAPVVDPAPLAPAPRPEEPVASKKPAARPSVPVLADKIAKSEIAVTPPKVIMSEEHRRLCLANVGGQFPAASFLDPDGKSVSLSSLYGERMTIVVFWNDNLAFAREQFDRMDREVGARYGVSGVSIVAVNVGDAPEHVQKCLADSPKKFPCLMDPHGEAFKTIAVGKLPRTYVLDKNGKVLWLDIEYSRDMRRELDNAVHFFLRDTL